MNLLNELGKRYIMLGLLSILFIFLNEFHGLSDTGARILCAILSYDPKNTLKTISNLPYIRYVNVLRYQNRKPLARGLSI